MQTLPLKPTFPAKLQKVWANKKNDSQEFLPKDLTIVTENLGRTKGSCCDEGRNEYQSCGKWWYMCPNWGLRDFTTWLKIGETGYTFPTSTEHKGVRDFECVM